MIHEAVRDQLAQAELAAGAAPRRLDPGGVGAKLRDRRDQLADASAGRRHRLQHRRPPLAGGVAVQRQVRLNRGHQPVRAFTIGLVDDEDVGNLHDPGLQRLHIVSRTGHQRDNRDVGRPDDIHLVLANAHRLDDDRVLAGGVEHQRRVAGRPRQAAEVAPRRHAADEHVLVRGMGLHPQAVAEDRAAAERAGGIDGDHADRVERSGRRDRREFFALTLRALLTRRALRRRRSDGRHQSIDQRALPRSGRAGDADEIGAAGAAEDLGDEVGARRVFVLDERDRAGDGARLAGEDTLGQRRHHAATSNAEHAEAAECSCSAYSPSSAANRAPPNPRAKSCSAGSAVSAFDVVGRLIETGAGAR